MEETLASLSVEDKTGQLFCLTGVMTGPDELRGLVAKYRPGGFMYRAGDGAHIRQAYRAMSAASRVSMLFPCDLESGGNGISPEGTFFSRPLGVAATGGPEQARRLGRTVHVWGLCPPPYAEKAAPVCDDDPSHTGAASFHSVHWNRISAAFARELKIVVGPIICAQPLDSPAQARWSRAALIPSSIRS